MMTCYLLTEKTRTKGLWTHHLEEFDHKTDFIQMLWWNCETGGGGVGRRRRGVNLSHGHDGAEQRKYSYTLSATQWQERVCQDNTVIASYVWKNRRSEVRTRADHTPATNWVHASSSERKLSSCVLPEEGNDSTLHNTSKSLHEKPCLL